jgi:hypothetical protein
MPPQRPHVTVPRKFSEIAFKQEIDLLRRWVREKGGMTLDYGLGRMTMAFEPVPIKKFGREFEAHVVLMHNNEVFIDIIEIKKPRLPPSRLRFYDT